MSWQQVRFNAQNLLAKTGSSVKISLPKKSRWPGWVVWHPLSMCQVEPWLVTVRFPDTWVFRLTQYSAGGHAMQQTEIDAATFLSEFDNPQLEPPVKQSGVHVEDPSVLVPEQVGVPDELTYNPSE